MRGEVILLLQGRLQELLLAAARKLAASTQLITSNCVVLTTAMMQYATLMPAPSSDTMLSSLKLGSCRQQDRRGTVQSEATPLRKLHVLIIMLFTCASTLRVYERCH